MANWCSNSVEFIGEHSQFEQLKDLFTAMAEKERKEGKGQLPDFVTGNNGFLFYICWEFNTLFYDTKWSPNTDILVKIAKHLKVGFVHSYSEPGNLIYGESAYKDGILTDVSLDWDDMNTYTYNEETGLYEFEGQEFECSEEIQDIILDRKKKAFSANTSPNNLNNNQ